MPREDSENRWRVWPKVPLANANTLLGFTENTRIAPVPAWCRKPPLVHLVVPAPVPLRRPRLGETFKDVPLFHLDSLALDHDVEPSLHSLQPVVRITFWLVLRFTAFCSPTPVAK